MPLELFNFVNMKTLLFFYPILYIANINFFNCYVSFKNIHITLELLPLPQSPPLYLGPSS